MNFMSEHKQISTLIQQSAENYLDKAGHCGKLLKDFNRAFEKVIIETTIGYYDNNLSLASKALGISRTTLYDKLKLYNID